MYRLRKPLPREEGESLLGLVARNADKYHFRNPRLLLARANPPPLVPWTLCDTDPAGQFGIRLRTLLGIDDEAAFRRMSPWTGDPTTMAVMGHSVWRELMRPAARAVCPLCLSESAHHRSLWFVSAMSVCAVHGVWLRTKCHRPRCQAPLSWFNSSIHQCSRSPQCTADLRKAPPEPAPPGAMRAMMGLHRLAHAEPGTKAGPLGLEFGEALKLSFLLGQTAFDIERPPFADRNAITTRPPGFMQHQGKHVPEIVARGWEALDDWPHGFHRLLDGLREQAAERAGKGGLKKAFGSLSAKVYHWAREPWGAPIGDAFANYVASQGDLATTAHTIRRYAPGAEIRHMFITTAEAQRALGMSPSTILRMARRRGLYELPPQGAGVPSLIRADVFREIADEAKDFLLPEEARRELGVGRKVMEQLEAASLIRRLSPSQLVLNTKPFRRSEIIAFVTACTTHAVKLTKEEAKQRKLSTIVSATAPGRTVPDICRALADGSLQLVACVAREKGLLTARLLLTDVERVLPSTKETLSLLDAAKQIGLGWVSLNHWATHGLLETTSSEGVDERGLRVSRETWDRFCAEYVTSKMLARELGQKSNTWVSRHLSFLGVRPVSGEGVDGGRTMLFRRADVGPEVKNAIRRLQRGAAGTPQDKHRRSFARAAQAAVAVAQEWGAVFTRDHNLFTDAATGRAVQVISGRRPDLTGVFVFHLRTRTLDALHRQPDPWVALVPNEGERFLMIPADRVPWRGGDAAEIETRYLSVRFDGRGQPLELAEWDRPLPAGKDPGWPKKVRVQQPRRAKARRSFDRVVQVAAEVERHWNTKLEGNRNAFAELGGDRRLHVICGRPCGGPTKQIFNIWGESFNRLNGAPGGWVALVPEGGTAFVLAPVGQVAWCGQEAAQRHVRIRIDARGVPMELGGTAEAEVILLTSGTT